VSFWRKRGVGLPESAAKADSKSASSPSDPESDAPPQGAPPHPKPWPKDPHLDPALLASGDHRNVCDEFRYWKTESICEALRLRQHPFQVAVEHWGRDANLGSMVRSANAFGAARVHLIGPKRWNRRGAMMTDRYLQLEQHESVDHLIDFAKGAELPIIGIDNLEGSCSIFDTPLPKKCVLLFGEERAGLSNRALAACSTLIAIPGYGSTRSINASSAAAIVMFEWCRQHASQDRP